MMRPMSDDSARISPTAHYTSYVWFKNGMSHPALATRLGRALHAALLPMNVAYERLGTRPNLDMMLLARHRIIDHLLGGAIARGEIGQVVEIAAGLSPRGWRFARGFPDLRYVEADLPHMAGHKRAALERGGLLGSNHEIATIDALADDGPDSLAALCAERLDPEKGTAIITEGLLGYFARDQVEGMWRRFATALGRFPRGLYLADLNMAGDAGGMRGARAFRAILAAFARGKVYLHYRHPDEATNALRRAGFASVALRTPDELADAVEIPGVERRHIVRIVEARV
jgi:O-methyltransferase involved in polyketide biosynthesis